MVLPEISVAVDTRNGVYIHGQNHQLCKSALQLHNIATVFAYLAVIGDCHVVSAFENLIIIEQHPPTLAGSR